MLITLPSRIKPARGFSHLVHVGLLASLPILAYILVRINFVAVAIGLVLISKWRIVAVRPRYWVANIVANGVDIGVGLALVLVMRKTSVTWWQLFWMALYIVWLTWLK